MGIPIRIMHTFLCHIAIYKLIYMLPCIIWMIMILCWTDWITISSFLCRCHRHITPLSFIHVNSDKTYLNIQTLKTGRPQYDSHDEIVSPIHSYSFTQPIAPDKTIEVGLGVGYLQQLPDNILLPRMWWGGSCLLFVAFRSTQPHTNLRPECSEKKITLVLSVSLCSDS